MRWRSLFSALVFLLLPLAAAAAQNNIIRGKVRSTGGTTLNNAIVELKMGGGGILSQTVTNNEGNFAFSNLVSAEYEVEVTLAGYQSAAQLVRFNYAPSEQFQEILNIEIVLKPKPEAAIAAPGVSFAQEVPQAAREAYEEGMAKLREGKSEEGIALLEKAIAHFKDYFAAHFALGTEFCRIGKDREALQSLERARQINDREAKVYHLFGMLMARQEKFAVAEYAFSEAIHLDGNNASSHFYRGIVLIEIALRLSDRKQRADHLSEAEKEIDRAWELSNRRMTDVYLQRARIYEQRGEKEDAARALENYLKAEPRAKNAAAIREAIARLRGKKK
ncbi:MAG: carboxypeptidase regulatory-like domain-containing protein [Blastocatellia bacterium]|nr:carboxypeptidase regulatory-like domain-containing protein [Blastocatellia bacterium]